MNNTHLIQLSVLGVGVAGLGVFGKILSDGGKLEHEPNVLTLKGSPFGRTLAFAMRGPVDIYWHRGSVHEHEHGDHDHSHGGDHDHSHGDGSDHSHGPGDDHSHGDDAAPVAVSISPGRSDNDHDHGLSGDGIESLEKEFAEYAAELGDHLELEEHDHGDEERPPLEFKEGVRPFMLDMIKAMQMAYYSRNSEFGHTAMHRAFILAETERRLSLSFQMDPTNLACYGSYYLFISEALVRVEGREDESQRISSGQQKALDLSNFTLQYCLKYQDEAPAMLTAATAAHDYLQIYLATENPDLKQAEAFLGLLDHTLARYEWLRGKMMEEEIWGKLGEHRIMELEGAHSLIKVLRRTDHEVYQKLKSAAAGG